ncbi:MAG: hypothetical protein L3J91_00350 [Thermoplasmata archaeon]|nr:hypothetical protein [Thermoplasmata archaeon]
MQGVPPPPAPPASAPQYPYYPGPGMMMPRRNWKPIAGAVKMTALTLEGFGIIVAGVSIGYLVNSINNVTASSSSNLTSFLNTLEAGLIISGVGAILFGIGLLIDSL